jgi:WD40 repeat protein
VVQLLNEKTNKGSFRKNDHAALVGPLLEDGVDPNAPGDDRVSTLSCRRPPWETNQQLNCSSKSTGELLLTLEGHTDWVTAVAFPRDGRFLASGSDDGTARLWDAATGDILHVLERHTDWVRVVAFSHDSSRLATASHDRTVRLWDVETDEEKQVFGS